MGVEVLQKPDAEPPSEPAPAMDVEKEKSVIPLPPEGKPEKVADPAPIEKHSSSSNSADRDAALARIDTEKKMSLIKAWEDNEKTKAENKAQKKMASIGSWENTKTVGVEAKLKKLEEDLEKQKANYAEKMKNKVAMLHKEAEEKKAYIEGKRREELLKAEEMAAKYRSTGHVPKKVLGCFGG